MPRGSFNYGDIIRIARGLAPVQRGEFAAILESISEGDRMAVTTILKNLVDGTTAQHLPKDARELLIAVARKELGLIN